MVHRAELKCTKFGRMPVSMRHKIILIRQRVCLSVFNVMKINEMPHRVIRQVKNYSGLALGLNPMAVSLRTLQGSMEKGEREPIAIETYAMRSHSGLSVPYVQGEVSPLEKPVRIPLFREPCRKEGRSLGSEEFSAGFSCKLGTTGWLNVPPYV